MKLKLLHLPKMLIVLPILGIMSSAVVAGSDAMENTAAIIASEKVCGYSVNREMLEISIKTLIGDPESLGPGGEHNFELTQNFERIAALTATSEGHSSFCNRVKNELSAFFD